MSKSETREQLRQIYQVTDTSDKTYIPARPKRNLDSESKRMRTCAYCRVSTGNDEQLSSYELQLKHYKELAENHSNWDLIKIYADEGISGTSTKKRDAFNEMVAACERGEYDLIVTKSVSRFARNIVDCITIARKLKHQMKPVGIYFETDNLYTLSEESELMLSFLATIAQEESVKKSEAMNWSLNQRFKDGKLLTPSLLGYDRPKDSYGRYIKYANLEVNEEEANIVRFIYDAYLSGWTQEQIAAFLTDIQCSTKTGNTEWNAGSIRYILTNERYCGNILTWKTFTADLYEHKHKKNRQDRDQYLYKEQHDAIISVEKFEAVQILLENKKHHMVGFPSLQVIGEGIFRGFIPINHHWVNDNPDIYYDVSNSVKHKEKTEKFRKRIFSAFDLEGYQVVRGEFMQVRYEGPTVTVSEGKISFNTFCVRKFEDIAYIQILLHPAERKIAIRPCKKEDKNSICWRPDPVKKVNSKTLSCQYFVRALYSIMGWNPEYLYRIRGTWVSNGKEQIIMFVLSNAVPLTFIIEENENAEIKKKRVDMCPEEWDDDFGDEFYEHSLENGYYYVTPKDEWKSETESITPPGMEQITVPTEEQLRKTIDNIRNREREDNEQ